MNKLNIVAVIPPDEKSTKKRPSEQSRRQEAQAKYERQWLLNPAMFDPLKDCMGRERIAQTKKFVRLHVQLKDKKGADLGCGPGVLSSFYASEGGDIDAVDIASQPLKIIHDLKIPSLHPIQDYVPHTLLKDDAYDFVAATEIIAELAPQEYRLFFSELARLANKEAHVLCSTPIDIYSDDALSKFLTLAETEFEIIDHQVSYHFLWIKLGNVLVAPNLFGQACTDQKFRETQLNERQGPLRTWFELNSAPIIGHIWKAISWLTNPLHRIIDQQTWLLHSLESISKFFWNEHAISHVMIIARRKPLFPPVDQSKIPPERQQKRRIWE